MILNYKTELESVGYTKGPDEFRELVADVFAQMHAGWTDEDLICRPDDAKRFCQTVKRRMMMSVPYSVAIADYVILRALTNHRKH